MDPAPAALRRWLTVAASRPAAPGRLRGALAAVTVAVLALAPTAAAADEVVVYPAEGQADVGLADARTRALDVAFAAAVTEAVADLAGAGARGHAAAIDAELIRRARRFVASFSVTGQRTAGGQLVLAVDVKVERDKVRAKLAELGVPLSATPVTPEPPPVARRRATVLMRVSGLGRPLVSFGAAATDDVPGLPAVGEALDRAGFAVVAASAAGPSPGDGAGLPVDDDGARALAGDARADVAVIVGVAVGEPGPVRGVASWAAPASAQVRVLDVARGKALTEARLATGVVGKPDRERLPVLAAEAAAAAVLEAGLGVDAPVAPAPIVAGPPLVAARGVTVRVRGTAPWAAVAAIRGRLATIGDARVTFAGVGRGQVALAVDGMSAARIAGQLRTTEALDATVHVTDDAVEVVSRSRP